MLDKYQIKYSLEKTKDVSAIENNDKIVIIDKEYNWNSNKNDL